MVTPWVIFLLASVRSANEDKIEFKVSELESPVQEVLYCGAKKETILILTEERNIFRSESSGNSWKPVQPETSQKFERIVTSKADPKLIVLLGRKGKNWYSEDCGRTLTELNYEKLIANFQFHPKMRTWGLAESWTQCTAADDPDCKAVKTLYLTKDLGRTWEAILDTVVQFSWGNEGFGEVTSKEVPYERIYATRRMNQDKPSKIGWNFDIDFLYSDTFFADYEVLVPHGNKFLLADKYILVATAVEADSEEVQLMVSSFPDLHTFAKAELPVKRIPEHSYTLVDTSEGSIMIQVNHFNKRSDYGTVYVSDSSGMKYSVSLLYNVRARSGYCDFQKVKGLEGIFIANVYDKDLYLDNVPDKKTKNQALKFQKTVITFDKGGEWKRLDPPERDSAGKRIICEDECALNLHSVTSVYSPAYSTDNAVGIIIGTGNVGKFLSYKEDELNTYLSRDGGVTWTEIRTGEFIYEFGDHGAIILMADSQKATDTLLYSWNEGMTWEKLKIDYPIEVENIVIEPTATSQRFLVYGEKDGKGVVVAVDFSTFHEPLCKNPGKPGKADSDYEIWIPNTGNTNSCLMGHITQYIRRKQEAECYNGEEFERPKFIKNCECTEEDFECDYGYYRETGGVCKEMDSITLPEPVCSSDGFKTIPTGYRRVSGNTCEGGVSANLEPKQISCSNISSLLLPLILILICISIIYLYQKGLLKIPSWSKEDFDRTGFFSDLTKAPEGAEELTDTDFSKGLEEEEFDPRS
jgi:hypothetical protein